MKQSLFAKPIFREDYIEELQKIRKKLKKEYITNANKNNNSNLIMHYLLYISNLDNKVLSIMGDTFYDKMMAESKIIRLKEELYNIAFLYTVSLENNKHKKREISNITDILKERVKYLNFLKTLNYNETIIIFKNNNAYQAVSISDTINCYSLCMNRDITLIDIVNKARILQP